jgi:hypothetical protein
MIVTGGGGGQVGPQLGKTFLHVFILDKILKLFFFRTNRPISINYKSSYIYSVKGNDVCTNKRPGPF